MYHIDSIKIEGLWGRSEPLQINFDPDFNFLIGQNGSGKTTVINLMAAALTVDVARLGRTVFSKLTIKFSSVSSKKFPSVEVFRRDLQGVSGVEILYSVKSFQGGKSEDFHVDRIEDDDFPFIKSISGRIVRERYQRRNYKLKAMLSDFLNVRWLSINRVSDEFILDGERAFASMVDGKLTELAAEISKYIAKLGKIYADKTLEFQQESLLSLIKSESKQDIMSHVYGANVDGDKEALEKIFELLGVNPRKYKKTLDVHSENYSAAVSKLANPDAGEGPISIVELGYIYNGVKARYLIDQYKELQKTKTEIFSLKDTFLLVVNDLLYPRKFIDTSQRGELVVFSGMKRPVTEQDKPIKFEDLSSGEKQLLIILGEALLQENNTAIYIADEPELSLHVKWQEKLTGSIKAVNPNAQVIFATHSPDIVGVHEKQIIDMERF